MTIQTWEQIKKEFNITDDMTITEAVNQINMELEWESIRDNWRNEYYEPTQEQINEHYAELWHDYHS